MANPNQKDNDEQGEMVFAIMLVFLAVFCWLIWTYFRTPIVYAVFGIKYVQLYVASFFTDYYADVAAFVDEVFSGQVQASQVTFTEFAWVSEWTGNTNWIPISILLMAMAVTAVFKMKGDGYKRLFTLGGGVLGAEKKKRKILGIEFGKPRLTGGNNTMNFMKYQAEHWKVATPSANFNPDIASPENDPALTPMEWMKKNNVAMTMEDGLDVEAAKERFIDQLGDRWDGYHNLPPYAKCIMIMCCLNATHSHKINGPLKGECAILWDSMGKDVKAAAEKQKKLLAPFEANKKIMAQIEKICGKHAYVNTAMYAITTWSKRKGGIFAPAEIRWLKPLNRTMWYAMSNNGRRKFFVEGAGIVSHFQAERVLGIALTEPRVDEAVAGLQDYFDHQGIADLESYFEDLESDD